MAPPKLQVSNALSNNVRNATVTTGVVTRRGTHLGTQTRSQNPAVSSALGAKQQPPNLFKDLRAKRKAENSPVKDKVGNKRSALGNITNAIGKSVALQLQDNKKLAKKIAIAAQTSKLLAAKQTEKAAQKTETAVPVKPKQSTRTRQQTTVTKKEEEKVEVPSKNVNKTRKSLDLEKSEDSSLYVSALEEVPEEITKRCSRSSKDADKRESSLQTIKEVKKIEPRQLPVSERYKIAPETILPSGVQWDFDAENWQDPYQVSHYAMDIFNYLKDRERLFPIVDYMERQVCLTKWMRSLLVDWMVAVQESFELNHETLYLAVKLVDLYLCKVTVGKETLQLLGAASLFIASKYDERIPPMIEDFLYICDGAYTQRELTRMEISILKIMDFDLGIPLSYRFLRRYARCAKLSMPTLTLARYILEYTLMDYGTISFSDSKIAAAALFLALQMKDLGSWTPTLEYYTGYRLSDFADIAETLNEGLHRKPKEALQTVRNKYSHKIFFEVAKVPLKNTLDL